MKKKHYEETSIIYFSIFILLIVEIIFILEFPKIKVDTYENYTTILLENNELYFLVNKKERKILYENSQVYLNNKKIKYEIIKDTLLEDKKHYEVIVKISKKLALDKNETITVAIRKNKINMIDMIKQAWGGDNNH